MLKIKDNVDLKELLNYEFELEKDEKREFYAKKIYKFVAWRLKKEYVGYIKVMPISKTILIKVFGEFVLDDFDTLYDLIEAGLVEKC